MWERGLVAYTDEVVCEAFCDFVGFAGDDGSHVDADKYGLVCLYCDQTITLTISHHQGV